ncbi:formate/nitrite transporter [Pseudomonas oryzihabitans]|nr:formate/nitrite transporter [Pseudomonas psychrotolerans]KTT11606.1 formate/nitrite transporter [Pseudomonas psychrotolerans]KTT25783.1 formate/nitrite transporter [Pseudomonas psychrotolerans]KTT40836.1 formate/nitrite transporter [Pseudomonas psychrotolerans]KTT67512.1 formate/nitrite transporter [Pseudomonas psychrotolerans]
MSLNTPKEIALLAVQAGVAKSRLSIGNLLVLGFLAGAFIALGFLLDIHVIGTLPGSWGSLSALLGAMVFPLGLILTVLAGGELLTGNMLLLPMAWFARRIRLLAVLRNFFWVTLANLLGALAVAYCFGHLLGLTEGAFLAKTTAIAQAKVAASFMQAFISGVGCNWLVCLAVWLAFAGKDVTGKILAMWFPIMAFVAIGFQHVVANMFILPAAVFAGTLEWAQLLPNLVAVFLGNLVGGAVFVGLGYHLAYRPGKQAAEREGASVPL